MHIGTIVHEILQTSLRQNLSTIDEIRKGEVARYQVNIPKLILVTIKSHFSRRQLFARQKHPTSSLRMQSHIGRDQSGNRSVSRADSRVHSAVHCVR